MIWEPPISMRKRDMKVRKEKATLEAYNLFNSVYQQWKDYPNLPFQLPTPLNYKLPEATLERTWLEGKRTSAFYFLMPEKFSKHVYGIVPSLYVKESARFLTWLHSLKPRTNSIDSKMIQSGHVIWMREIVDRYLQERLIEEEKVEKIRVAIDMASRHEKWGPVSLIHGDFKTQNVLIRKGGLAIIDFESIRHDFSYLDLTRFISNIKLRVSKYFLFKESSINRLTSIFIKEYEETRGEIDKEALEACFLLSLTQELSVILESYLFKMRSPKKRISGYLIKRNLNYILKEIMPPRTG